MTHEELKNRVYGYLIKYKKEELKIEDKGVTSGGNEYDCLIPEPYCKQTYPIMLYPGIKNTVADIQGCAFAYKPHPASRTHVASSQTACLNLFAPILESEHADTILKASGVAPAGFDHIERSQLRKGYCFEYWDSESKGSKGILGDHNSRAGTDSDVAICYQDVNGNLCLWLIEHKLTEKEFTECGGYKSKGNCNKELCRTSTLSTLYSNHKLCYYDSRCGYDYWDIMEGRAAKQLFSGQYCGNGCPFKGGMNQLWRNQMMALELERMGKFHNVFFSVVTHPENGLLDASMREYRKLINNSPKFSDFKSDRLVKAAESYLPNWAAWYKRVYLGK